jgi:rhodanese-related sulfurtransferase
LDTRIADNYEKAHILHSINIGTNGQFAIWAATLLDYNASLILITEPGQENEIITRLARVGIENVIGYLEGGFETWTKAGESIGTISSIEPEEMNSYINQGWKVLDVRKPGEFESGHIKNAKTLHLQILEQNINDLNKDTPYLIHCAGGYRSMMAASILKKHGFNNFVNVRKGWNAIQNLTDLSFETGPCEMERKKSLIANNN